jgi:hypothetical protein
MIPSLTLVSMAFSIALGGGSLSAAAIAERHVAAIGGYDRIHALQSISYSGIYRESGVSLEASQTYMRPYYEVVDPHLQPAILEGFDGRPWEYYAEFGVVLRTAGAPGMATTHASEFDDSLVDFTAKDEQIALVGEMTIQNRRSFDVLVTLSDGFQKHLYIDEQTYLINGIRQTAKVHAFGDRITSESVVGGYRRVAGLLFPTTFREIDLATGRELNRLTWTKIEINRPLPVALFSPPRFARTPLSALLEDLYARRNEPSYDRGRYEAFLRQHPSVNAEAGIEFIGYQILKTGVTSSAIALLAANAQDHPRSADAQFGLGRAYRVAGREQLAVAAFRHALRLNPSDARARAALQQS